MTGHASFAAGRNDLPGSTASLDNQAGSLHRSFDQNRDPSLASQRDDLRKTEAERRASKMVEEDRPKPVLRPSPNLAMDADTQAFNARWEAEKSRADANHNARKAAFKEQRRAQAQSLTQIHQRSKGERYER